MQLQQYQQWRGGGKGEERRGEERRGREERIGRECDKERRGRKGKREREERMKWIRGEKGREGMLSRGRASSEEDSNAKVGSQVGWDKTRRQEYKTLRF